MKKALDIAIRKSEQHDQRCETCRFFMKLASVTMYPFLGACALKGDTVDGRDIFVAVESDKTCDSWEK